jgi:protein-L-isoaspartate(D-aspartate) O-methyltransferase
MAELFKKRRIHLRHPGLRFGAISSVLAAMALLALASLSHAEVVQRALNKPAFVHPGAASDRPSDYRAIDLTPGTARNSPPAYDITKRAGSPPLTSQKAYVTWMLAHYPGEQEKYLRERWARAAFAVEHGHIRHERILAAFLLTPREWFVRPYNMSRAYANVAMPIGYGQTISGPDLVARMTDRLDPQPGQRVLEIGTGSGYQSAFLSELSNHVYTIEIVKPLAEQTNAIYLSHTREMPEYANIHRRIADGYYGWREYAPFARIIVTCGIDHIPPDLIHELAPGGIMLIPVGPPSGQTILKITKHVAANGRVTLTREDIYHGTAKDIFVPFTAAGGGVHSLVADSRR